MKVAVNWMQHRIRSKWTAAVLPIAILQILQKEDLDEWRVMDSLYKMFGSALDEKDAKHVLKVLMEKGFVEVNEKADARRLQVSKKGFKLLSALRKEYGAIIAGSELEM